MTSAKTYYLNHGTTFRMTDDHALKVQDALPPGHYSIMASMEGLYLQNIPTLSYSGKLYGNIEERAARIINTYLSRDQNTGLLLEGEKGAGKTLLLRILAEQLLKIGVSTLVVNGPFAGEGFNKFISDIQQPAMILFDEFEKVYTSEAQEQLLTLFDGLYHTKKLFAVSINDYNKLLSHLKNRPGRMYYHFKYETLDEATVKQYVQENLKDKDKHEATLIGLLGVFDRLNFDMLKAIIEEMNRYNEDLRSALEYVNAAPVNGAYDYSVKVIPHDNKDEDVFISLYDLSNINIMQPFRVHFGRLNAKGKKLGEDELNALIKRAKLDELNDKDFLYFKQSDQYLTTKNLKGLKDKTYTFDTKDYTFEVKRKESSNRFDWRNAL